MNRMLLLALAIHGLCAATATGEDFLLRVDAIQYADKLPSERPPSETILRSLEVVARPQLPFHGKIKIGTQSLILAGELRRADDGNFNVEIRYSETIDPGSNSPSQDGSEKPATSSTAIRTRVAIAVGESVTLGGLEAETTRSGVPQRRSRTRYSLTLSRYEPAGD